MKKLWYHFEKNIVYEFDGSHVSFLLEKWEEMELKKSSIQNKIAYDAGWARIHIEKGDAGIEAKDIETIHKAALWLNKKYGILKLFLGQFNQKDGFYQIKLTGTIGQPRATSL